jgi:integrase
MLFLDAVEVNRLADAIDEPYGVLVRFAAYTGLRAGELAALRVGRVDLLRGSVDVREAYAEVHGALVLGPTKTYGRRTVALPRFLCDELGAYLVGRDVSPDAHLFTSPDGGPLRQSNFYRRTFKPAVRAAGLPDGLRFHDLRHTCAALLIAQGAHPRALMERLGHSSVTVSLDRYGHLLPSLDEALVDGLEDTYRRSRAASPRPERSGEVIDMPRSEAISGL